LEVDDSCNNIAGLLWLLTAFKLTLESAEAVIVSYQTIRSWYTGHWWVGCYIWYSEEGTVRGCKNGV